MRRMTLVLMTVTLLAGCGPGKPEVTPSPDSGRAETRRLEAARAAGYDGTAVRRSVDKVLDQTDARNAETARIVDAAHGK